MKTTVRLQILSAAACAATLVTAVPGQTGTIEFKQAKILVETNASAMDAGFQVFLDTDGWKEVRVIDPRGRTVLEAEVDGGAKRIGGGTELFLETNEPEYEDLAELRVLLNRLQEGEYRFLGRTVTGQRIVGSAVLTHVVPAGPEVTAPLPQPGEECATSVDPDEAAISWRRVTRDIFGSPDIEIVGYQVIVEGPSGNFQVNLPADATEVTIPAEFVEPDAEYAFEILAIEASDNQTITEGCFGTE